jgi:multidrug efflux pump
MGIAVVGGMLVSTVLTLYVVPTIYSYISKDKKLAVPLEESSEVLLSEKNPASLSTSS